MSTPASPFIDHAAPILSAEPSITDAQREDLWDAFHTKNTAELVQHLAPLAISDDLKHKLWQAKQAVTPVPPPVDKVTAAMQRMITLDPKVLEVAEAHPNVLKVLTTAATTPEKPAQEAAGGASTDSKGDTAVKALKTPSTPLPPRPDGQPHLPAIPAGHKRILASDNGIHDIPEENLGAAQAIDPNLHVLNP